MTRSMRNGTILFGAGLFLLGLHMLRSSLHWGVYGPEGPGPGFFPLVYAIVMLVFSAALVAQTVVKHRETAPAGAGGEAPPDRAGTAAALIAWLALMISVPLMSFLGFVVGFGLTLFFIIRVVFRRATLTSLVTSAGIVAGLYVGFTTLMGLTLPASKYWGF